ncbi:hypothetical protein AB0N93_15600 [Streptomyces sp. NPDC091267]|uniref:hypothetical protein n=1 Tax=unclassified Streptomyces TaxID=2593676 RepID=UPI00342FAAFB
MRAPPGQAEQVPVARLDADHAGCAVYEAIDYAVDRPSLGCQAVVLERTPHPSAAPEVPHRLATRTPPLDSGAAGQRSALLDSGAAVQRSAGRPFDL